MNSATKYLQSVLSIAAFMLLLASPTGVAYELVEVSVDYEDGRYRVYGQSRIEASPSFVYATLIDYDNFHKLAGGIVETRFLPDDESGDRMAYTRFESCVLFFCKVVEKVERIEIDTPELIKVSADPERSDFVFNESSWIIEHAGNETLLTFTGEFDPDFWVPPVIGNWAIRNKLEKSAESVGLRIEWMHARGLTLAQVSE